MRWLPFSWLVGVLLVVGCSDPRETPSPTQVVVRVRSQDEALLGEMTGLRIAVARQDGDDWTARGSESLPIGAITWPVDVPISPSNRSAASKPFEVVVEAVKDDAVLAQARVVVRFVAGEWRLLELWLYRCAGAEPVCAEPDCHGLDCSACRPDGRCAPVGLTTATETYDPHLPPSDGPVPGAERHDAGPDAERPDCWSDSSCLATEPCAIANGGCHSNALCSAGQGVVQCSCKDGFEDVQGDGSECVDKCSLAGCHEHATCEVVAGEAQCRCEKGYVGSGTECSFDERCADLSCDEHAHCVVEGASRRCQCDDGYEGSGKECTDIDECKTASCAAGFPCMETEPPGYTCLGQLADWPMPDSRPGAKFPTSYDTSVEGVVMDNVTGLMWQREFSEDISGCSRGACGWNEAEAYCESLALAGYDDWRLPSRIELVSLVDKPGLASVFPEADVSTPLMIWSSTPAAGLPGAVWTLIVSYSQSGVVKCVRRGVPLAPGTPETRYVSDVANNLVKDLRTGLDWQRDLPASYPGCSDDGCTALEATRYCASLGGGWRVPSHKELFTLYDHTRGAASLPDQGILSEPSLNLSVFPAERSERGYVFIALGSLGDAVSAIVGFDLPTLPPFGGGSVDSRAPVRCVR